MVTFAVKCTNVYTGASAAVKLDANMVTIILASGNTLEIYTTKEADVLDCVVTGAASIAIRLIASDAFRVEMR